MTLLTLLSTRPPKLLAGSTAVTVTVAGAVRRIRQEAATTAITVLTTGTVQRQQSLSGAISLTTTVSANVRRIRNLASTVVITTTTTGAVQRMRSASGVITVSIGTTANVQRARNLASNTALVITASNINLLRLRGLSAATAVSSSVSGAVFRDRHLAGTTHVVIAITAYDRRTSTLRSTTGLTVAVSGSLQRVTTLSESTVAVIFTATGTLSVENVGVVHPPTNFYTIMEALLSAIDDALVISAAGSPDRVCVVPGAIAWDDCQCGQLAATVSRIYYSDAFPAELQAPIGIGNCEPSYVVGDIFIGLVRCAPTPQNNAISVSVEELDMSMQSTTEDAGIVSTTVMCTLKEMVDSREVDDYLIREQVYDGPQGGCVGSTLRVSVGLLNNGIL